MGNTLETVKIFQTELDKAVVEGATSGWMELNDKLVKYTGGSEVKIPKITMDGLADYSRETGFVEGGIDLSFQTKELTMDRGRIFTIDEMDVDESNFILTASSIIGEFQRTKVIPEIDAYRYSAIASLAIQNNKTVNYTASEADILKQLYSDIATVQDVVGEETELVITMSTKVASLLDMSSQIQKSLSVIDFTKGNLSMKVSAINGQYPIIRASSSRMKTAFIFQDGTSNGQTAGGFKASSDAKDINWIICPKNVPIAVSKTDKIRTFTPEQYQPKRAWAIDYRKFHDIWIPDNKWESILVNLAGSSSTSSSSSSNSSTSNSDSDNEV